MFKHPFSFRGLIRRSEYGFTLLIFAFTAVIVSYVGTSGKNNAIAFVLFFPLIWFLYAQGAKRCHDLGHSGWFQAIPYYVFWMLAARSAIGLKDSVGNPLGTSIHKRSTGGSQKAAVMKWIPVILFWLLVLSTTLGIYIQKNVDALFTIWFILLVFLAVLIIQSVNIRRRTGKNDASVVIRILMGISSIALLIFTTVHITIYQSTCMERLAADASLCYCRFENADLNHRDLHGSDFTGVVFYRACLVGVNFKGANLTSAIMAESKLNESILTGAVMRSTNLSKADLEGVDFENANLSNADLTQSNLTNATLAGVAMDSANLQGAIGLSDDILCNAFRVSRTGLSQYLSSRMIRLESEDTIWERLKSVCLKDGVSEAALYNGDSTFHPIVAYRTKKDTIFYKGKLPGNWQPMALRFSELVACIGEEKEDLIQTCQYTMNYEITRYGYRIDVTIKSAKTSEKVGERTFWGEPPSDCPETTSNSRSITGGHVKDEDITAWLRTYVNPRK